MVIIVPRQIKYGVSKASDATRVSLLLDLPLDIRLLVLEVLFTLPDGIQLDYSTPSGKDSLINPSTKSKIELFVALLVTCRQLYTESVKILYGKNRFYFSVSPPQSGVWVEPRKAKSWINSLGHSAVFL